MKKGGLPFKVKLTKVGVCVGLFVVIGVGAVMSYLRLRPGFDPNSPRYREILGNFLASQPTAVNVSPDGRFLLTKAEQNGGFKVSILDANTKREVQSTFSKNSQLSLTWQPDSRAVVFQEISGMDRPLFLLDLQTGGKQRVNGPVSQTALPPLRWNSTGTRLAYFDGDWRSGRLLIIDPSGRSSPVIIREHLSYNCDLAWSPDAGRLAFTSESDPGLLAIVTVNDLKSTQFRVSDGEVRKLAWSPDGATILASARGPQDEYFKLLAIDAQTGKFSVKAQAVGDINQPVWMPDGQGFIFHVNSNGITRAFLERAGSPDIKVLGPTNGVLTVTHFAPDGKTAYAHFSGLTTPPTLVRISPQDGSWTELYACPTAEQSRCPEPGFITVKNKDGVNVPAYHWKATPCPGVKPSALIVVHGGLHTQTFPTWEAYIRVMTSMGCEVIAVNHRGSTGMGQHYENLEGDPVLDVIAARDYAANALKVEPGRIFLTGISTGSRLIALAAGYGTEVGGLILVSWPGDRTSVEKHFAKSFPVWEFHGDLDVVMSPGKAHESIEKFFGSDQDAHFNIRYRVFQDEGHFFYRANSRAAIYFELSKLIEGVQ